MIIKMTQLKCILSIFLCLPLHVLAGPFDLKMGMPTTEISKLHKLAPIIGEKYTYEIIDITKTNNDIDSVLLISPPISGLCRIIVLGKYINTGNSGDELKKYFNLYTKALISKYKYPDSGSDFVTSSSPWQGENEWMMGLLAESRKLSMEWGTSNRLPENIAIIQAYAKATTQTKGNIIIQYYFRNFGDCSAEKELTVNPKGF